MELQWPLIIFTTLLAWSCGVFATQGVLALKGEGKEIQLPALIASVVLLAVSGIAVFFHLQHWERIFNGFGHLTSGITQELIAIVVFVVVAVVYFAMLRKSEDGGTVPQWLAVVAIAISVVLAVVSGPQLHDGRAPRVGHRRVAARDAAGRRRGRSADRHGHARRQGRGVPARRPGRDRAGRRLRRGQRRDGGRVAGVGGLLRRRRLPLRPDDSHEPAPGRGPPRPTCSPASSPPWCGSASWSWAPWPPWLRGPL